MALLRTRLSRSHLDQPPLTECVTGDRCAPTWLATSGPPIGSPWDLVATPVVPDPAATVLVTERVFFDEVLVAIPGDYITPAQAAEWGIG
jgi:hypothetical protein